MRRENKNISVFGQLKEKQKNLKEKKLIMQKIFIEKR